MSNESYYQNILPMLSDHQNSVKELLDYIFNSITEGLAMINDEGIIIRHNTSLQNILEVDKTLIGKSFEKLIPNFEENNTENIYIINHNGKNLRISSKKIKADDLFIKMYFVSEYSTHLIIDENVSHALVAKKKYYENIINSVSEGVEAIDSSGRFFIYNSYFENIDGYKASEVLGKHIVEIYDLNWQTSLLLKVLKEKKPILNFHQKYTTKTGKHLNIIASTFPLYFDNKIIGSICIVKDFSNFNIKANSIQNTTLVSNKSNSNEKNTFYNNTKTSQVTILGNNQKFLESINWAMAASQTTSPVLIYGETGTGKELFAKSIHFESMRSKGPFIAINCAAIPENLLEGNLFGTVKGAFTGAINRMGLLEQADGGTLFLDEINSMPLALQAKLLRVLEEKKVTRLGGKKEISIDIRVISSSNVKPSKCIQQKQLREDLFYRLAVVYLTIPPLRERKDDIDLLIKYFINILNKRLNKNIKSLSKEVLSAFLEYEWPGNVRQLKHTIECAMNIAQNHEVYIQKNHIPKYLNIFNYDTNTVNRTNQNNTNLFDEIKNKEKNTIIHSLKENNGNITKTAEILGMSRQSLQYRIKKYKLK